ncbi:hypothetical protein N5P37_001900 [Trichoderma harzianum]|nr:hypothetical protein N5P37_001900 [Trichoderma harzianum]
MAVAREKAFFASSPKIRGTGSRPPPEKKDFGTTLARRMSLASANDRSHYWHTASDEGPGSRRNCCESCWQTVFLTRTIDPGDLWHWSLVFGWMRQRAPDSSESPRIPVRYSILTGDTPSAAKLVNLGRRWMLTNFSSDWIAPAALIG